MITFRVLRVVLESVNPEFAPLYIEIVIVLREKMSNQKKLFQFTYLSAQMNQKMIQCGIVPMI